MHIPTESIRFVKELYPRLKPYDEIIERYRDAIENLPPITIARDGVLVDGYHRWQAHVREKRENIDADNLGNLSDAEIIRESIKRNAGHGQQLSKEDKKRLAGGYLWNAFSHLSNGDRITEIASLLAIGETKVKEWTKEARKSEKDAQQAKVWDLWLDCLSTREIETAIGMPDKTVHDFVRGKVKSDEFAQPPPSRQHFDIWQFQMADKDAGSQSYFGALPPQVIENILWFYTEPGQIVVDPFAGSGTTIEVAKRMGRRVWASDIRGNHYAPHLPIHKHDITSEWPSNAPSKADLVFLDPPYWQQAAGRYSEEPNELAEMDLVAFYAAWTVIVRHVIKHANRVSYIISPTHTDNGVIDHATHMLQPFIESKWHVERRIIVPYQTQQATGQQVTWARENRRLLKLYRDLVVLSP